MGTSTDAISVRCSTTEGSVVLAMLNVGAAAWRTPGASSESSVDSDVGRASTFEDIPSAVLASSLNEIVHNALAREVVSEIPIVEDAVVEPNVDSAGGSSGGGVIEREPRLERRRRRELLNAELW